MGPSVGATSPRKRITGELARLATTAASGHGHRRMRPPSVHRLQSRNTKVQRVYLMEPAARGPRPRPRSRSKSCQALAAARRKARARCPKGRAISTAALRRSRRSCSSGHTSASSHLTASSSSRSTGSRSMPARQAICGSQLGSGAGPWSSHSNVTRPSPSRLLAIVVAVAVG